MAVDKLVDSTQLNADLTSVANAIRTKGGTSASLAFPAEFVSAIAAIPSGGSSPPRLIDSAEVTLASTATSSNKLSVNLTAATNCVVLVFVDEMPSPPTSNYTALCWCQIYTENGTTTAFGAILRPAGTVGNDTSMCSFNKSTGVLQLGGQYGYFWAGTKYQIYEFELG